MNGTDTNWRDEGELVAGVEWQTEVNEHGRFDNGDKNKWQSETFSNNHDDDENCDNGNGVDDLEVDGGKLDHVLGRAGFADKQGSVVVGFDDLVDAVDLSADFVGGGGVFGNDKGKFPVITL